LLSFALARLVFLALEVIALVAAGWLVFDVAVQGSLFTLALTALFGTTCFMGLALLVAARPEDTEVASGWMNVVMLPMWLLSGVFFSYERFPEAVHPVLRLLPLTALNDALRAVINEGAPLADQLDQLAVLAGWSLLTFLLARRFFKWR
jgi:ABC-type polysaccharide/polyol phosphate export permease